MMIASTSGNYLMNRGYFVVGGILDVILGIFLCGIQTIKAKAGIPLKIIRTMPSTPITIGEGVLAVSSYGEVSAKELQFFCRMMSSIAYVTVIDESLMNPIISVQGSSPAYVYLFIKAMLDASEKQGIDRNVALPLILKTIKGAVSMVEKCDLPIETLISNNKFRL